MTSPNQNHIVNSISPSKKMNISSDSPKLEPDTEPESTSTSTSTSKSESGISPRAVLIVFTLAQIMMYYDRGLLAGFLPSVLKDVGAKVEGGLNNSDAGLLGSGFILGYMCACPVFAYFAKYVSPYKLMCCGLLLWCAATWSCGFTHQYETFLFGRIITGIGEASFAGLAPTCIDDVAPPEHRTLWLSIFFAGLPVGGACGYVFGGIFALWSWRVGFLTEAFLMIPLALYIFFIPNRGRTKTISGLPLDEDEDEEEEEEVPSRPDVRLHLTRANTQPVTFNRRSSQHRLPVTTPSYLDLRLFSTHLSSHERSHRRMTRPRSHPSLVQYVHKKTIPQPPQTMRARTHDVQDVSIRDMTSSQAMAIPQPSKQQTLATSPSTLQAKYASSPSLTSMVPETPTTRREKPEHITFQQPETTTETQPSDSHSISHPVTIPVSPISHHDDDDDDDVDVSMLLPKDSFASDIWSLVSDPVYMFVVFGYAGLAFVIGALSFWAPVDFALTLRITLQQSTTAIGAITFICGILGTAFGGWILDYRGGGKGISGVLASLELSSVFTVLAIVFALAAVYSKNMYISLTCLAIADFFLFGTAAPINAALLSVSPNHLRSLGMALSILLMHLLGDLPSPFLMGYITDNMGDVQLALFGLCTWLLWTVLCWGIAALLANKRVQQLKHQLERESESESSPLLHRVNATYDTMNDDDTAPAPALATESPTISITSSTTRVVTGFEPA